VTDVSSPAARVVTEAESPTGISAHRRSFRKTTTLAICVLVVLLVAIAAALALLHSSAAHDHLPSWSIWVASVVSTVVLAVLSAYAALVAVGGMVVLYRDGCEERGVPYTPTRPRERILGPMTAKVRRSIRPGARLCPGETVEVRSLPEILATLDERGCLDGMPFMPEMEKYCGHRFQVHRRVDKVWEYAHGTLLRRVHDAVLLKTLRCDGQSHGGCQARCQLIWKEAWLRPAGAQVPEASGAGPHLDLDATTHVSVDGQRRYVCQMTEIIRASTQVSGRDSRHYWRDLVGGNVRLVPLLVVLGVRVFNGMNWRLGGASWPVLKPLETDSTPHQDTGVQSGQLVRVRSKHDIETTLNRKLRNRGLEFGTDMLFCCGGSYRVAARVDRILDERTGELLQFKTPSILLEGANANGGTVLTPQNEYFFWREIWLEPQPVLAEQESVR
jgi:hypothetical protein